MKKLLLLAIFCSAIPSSASAESHYLEFRKKFALPDHITFPHDGPFSPQVAVLGKMLFFDPRLSNEQNIACVTCHNPSFGWENPEPRTVGALNTELKRHTPSIANLFDAPYLFRDGSAHSLEDQARNALTNPHFMGAKMSDIVARLNGINSYKKWFDIAFPGEGITERTILRAIATYERTIVTGPTPFDDWVSGDETAISESAQRGFIIFVGRGRCAQCHSGWSFTDHRFHDIGLLTDDLGRGKIETGNDFAKYAFKTPGLRNIAIRAPYMHNGSLATLRDVVEHYRTGGLRRETRASEMKSIQISERDVEDLVAFLSSLTEKETHISAPALPAQ